MRHVTFAVCLGLFGFGAGATDLSEPDASLESYLWTARPVIVFADSPRDPRFVKQMADLEERVEDLEERDVIILTDTDASTLSALRERFRPRGFQMILVGKDGQIKHRWPHPIEAEFLNRQIDRMPMRRREMRGGQS